MSERIDGVVLYVDDDFSNRLVFEHTFKTRFTIETRADGASALERLREEPPVAVIVVDQRMPGMCGTDLLRRTRELHPSVQRMIVTAYEDPQPILEALNTGLVSRYIVKPWSRAEVDAALASCLEIHRLQRENILLEQHVQNAARFDTLGEIAAGVLHDLSQPVTVLNSTIELLQETSVLLGELSARVERGEMEDVRTSQIKLSDLGLGFGPMVQEIAAASRAMYKLVGASKSLLRGDRDAQPGHPQQAIEEAILLAGSKIRGTGGTLRLDLAPGLPQVRMSSQRLTRVIVNLLINAAHAIERRPAPEVSLTARNDEDGVTLVVRDNGAGMTPDVLGRAREPFFTTKAVGVGTGLGLSTIQRMLEEAGGRMTIESEAAVGTTVSVWVPRAS